MRSSIARASSATTSVSAAGTLAGLCAIDAPGLGLDELVADIQDVLSRDGASRRLVILEAPAPGSPESAAAGRARRTLVEEPPMTDGPRAQLLGAVGVEPAELVLPPHRFSVFPVGHSIDGTPLMLAVENGPRVAQARVSAIPLVLSLIRLKIASRPPAAGKREPLDAHHIAEFHGTIGRLEPQLGLEDLAGQVLRHLHAIFQFDLAGLLLEERQKALVAVQPHRPVAGRLEAAFVAGLLEDHLTHMSHGEPLRGFQRLALPPLEEGAERSTALASRLALPVTLRGGRVAGFLVLASRKRNRFAPSDHVCLAALVSQLGSWLDNRKLILDLERQAKIDEMTELYNYRTFRTLFASEFSRAKRYRKNLSLALIDIDHFKNVNDTLGHPAGDEALRRVARLLRQARRREDVVARYGGEEFVVVLPETSAEGARQLAERIRALVESSKVVKDRTVTISIGVACLKKGRPDSESKLIARADAALYRAKNGGRNRVEIDVDK